MKTFADFGIHVNAGGKGNVKTLCPQCSHNRKHKDDRCLSVHIEKGTWRCFNCDWRGCLGNGKSKKEIVDTYDYKDESGKVLFQSVRFFPKDFAQRHSDGNGGWTWNLKGIRRVPYRLPELIASDERVYIPGGEKDVETLVQLGLTATTNAGGEGNWRKEFDQYLKNRDVVILEDIDDKGQKHGKIVAESLHGIAKSIKIVRFEKLPQRGDVSDYLETHNLDDLLKKVEEAPLFKGSYSYYFGDANDPSEPNPDFDDEEENPTQSQILIKLASQCELFHSPDGEVFVTFPKNGHKETWRIKSKGFKRWMVGEFFASENKPPAAQALTDALGVLESKAYFKGAEYPIHVRVGESTGKIFIDFCNNKWEAIEISKDGWDIISDPPVKFIRSKGMSPLPVPKSGGSIDELRQFVNIQDEASWQLFVGYLVVSLKPRGPYPIAIIQGEQGSAKSTFCRIIRSLIDPNTAALRTLPRDERDLMIATQNGWIIGIDNISHIPNWLSDSLCRISTGGGFATRQLFTDGEEVLFDSQRPICLNGIEEIANRFDLRDRAIILNLPAIPENNRQDEETFWKNFNDRRPYILGALLDGIVTALKNIENVKLERSPRMADFARWVVAAEPALGWEPGSFLKNYMDNRAAAIEMGIDTDPVAQSVMELAEDNPEWEGTATELLDVLEKIVGEKKIRSKEWPKSAKSLSQKLRRLAPSIRSLGVELEFDTRQGGPKRRRLITIRKDTQNCGRNGLSGLEEDNLFKNNEFNAGSNAVAKKDMRTQETNADGKENGASVDNPLSNKKLIDTNAKTAKKPFNSDSGNDSREFFTI